DGSASWPLSHVSTTKPSYSRLSRSRRAIALSSSMIRTRFDICLPRSSSSRASTPGDRQRHVDLGSRADSAAHIDPSAVALDDALRDRQAETAAAHRHVAAAIEAFEDPRKIFARNSGPAI